MPDPQDQGFELNGVIFGQSGDVLVEDFQPGGYEIVDQDADVPMSDTTLMGRDVKRASSWVWSLGVNRDDEAGAYESLAALEEAWDAATYRSEPGAMCALRYRVNGRTRRVYGRPRRFAPTLDVRRLSGYIGIDCDFKRATPLHYDDAEESVTIGMQPSSTGGLLSPLVSPLTSVNDAGSAGRAGQITVGGNAPATLIIEIAGDVARPYVEAVGQWRLMLESTINAGDTVTVDSRPWVLSATRANGGSVAGDVRNVRISQLTLPPGDHELIFGGTSSTGGATATVRWRAASKSL